MKLNLPLILLIIALIYFVLNSFRFEKISDFRQKVIPVYCLVMFFSFMHWNLKNTIIALILVLCSVLIAYFQFRYAEIKGTNKHDKHGRPIALIKKNWPYLLGWVMIFLLGLISQYSLTNTLNSQTIIQDLGKEVNSELFGWTVFSSSNPWCIWLLSGVSSLLYTRFLIKKDKHIKKALGKKPFS